MSCDHKKFGRSYFFIDRTDIDGFIDQCGGCRSWRVSTSPLQWNSDQVDDQMRDEEKIDRLVDRYGHERALGMEYDNKEAIQRAKDRLMKAIGESQR